MTQTTNPVDKTTAMVLTVILLAGKKPAPQYGFSYRGFLSYLRTVFVLPGTPESFTIQLETTIDRLLGEHILTRLFEEGYIVNPRALLDFVSKAQAASAIQSVIQTAGKNPAQIVNDMAVPYNWGP